MQIINLPVVVVDNVGVTILTSAQANAATSEGLTSVTINPTIDIVLVDTQGGTATKVPGAVVGSVANSALVCPANTPTTLGHKSGAIKAISTGANSTVKVTLGCTP